jgi:pseudouridine-5'-phosphate glycosidase
MPKTASSIHMLDEVGRALNVGLSVVALESTVITHGLPYPQNVKLANDMEAEVRDGQAVPATIAVLDGKIRVGLRHEELERLGRGETLHKISTRDFAPAIAGGWDGGTTVAGSILVAHRVGIRVFATGGIGGVHRMPGEPSGFNHDVSADLPTLAQTPVIVVCAGAKAILDLPATLEYLETFAVPVVGYGTDEFPAFYSTSSGLAVSARADTPGEVAAIARAHWELGMPGAVLVVQPPPQEVAMPPEAVDQAIEQALREAGSRGVHGQAVTPFLLERVAELTHGNSMQANLGLLRNNARLAAQIARQFQKLRAV